MGLEGISGSSPLGDKQPVRNGPKFFLAAVNKN